MEGDQITTLTEDVIIGDSVFMGENSSMEDADDLFDEQPDISEVGIVVDFVVLFYHELDQLNDHVSFVSVHHYVHDDSCCFVVHLKLLSVQFLHVFWVKFHHFGQ